MKKRIFFIALLLFSVFLNSVILIVSAVILKDRLSVVRDKCLAEHYVIASSLIGDMQALETRGNHAEENMERLMRVYSRYLQGKGNGLAVALAGEWIYESPSFRGEEEEILPPDTGYGQERLVYMENGRNPVLCVYGSFPAPWQDYGLMYTGSLQDTILSWRHTKNMLFLTGAAAMLIMAFFLFQFLNIIFRPLRQISSTSGEIANGNYASRIPIQGKDEISSVAQNFNRMAQQVENQIQQLEDAAEQKQQFIDNFSHELRIPLTAIYGYAEYIQKALISEQERYECTRYIMSECGRLKNMAYQLLDMALLRTDETEPESCLVEALFRQSEKAMQVGAAEKKIKLTYAFSQDLAIRGNAEQLLILINNLIDNAIKASPPEEEIRICAYLEDSHIVVAVKDHGTGMEPDQVPHIKEAFYCVDKARGRAAGGAGLGLAICDRIVRMHQADMTFVSKPGRGTTVRLSFPCFMEFFTSQT